MKQMIRSLLAAILCCTLLFATACGERDDDRQAGGGARGRYVERSITLPEGNVHSLYRQPDGSLNLWIGDYETGADSIHSTKDFVTWQPEDMTWCENLPEGEALIRMAYDDSGVLYALIVHVSSDEYALYRVGADGITSEQVSVDWYRSPENEFRLDIRDFQVLGNGDFLFTQTFDGGIVQYGSDGSFKGVYETSDFSAFNTPTFTVSNHTIAILDEGNLRIYDGTSRELESQMDMEGATNTSQIYYGQNDVLYIQDSSGLYRYNLGGNLREKIIDGEFCSMSLPGLVFVDFVELQNGNFYLLVCDERRTYTVLEYQYDEDIATLPEHELVVYTLEENDVLRLAAVKYQELHPDTKINIQVASENSGVATNDLLRALNTELLGGKGPDILILDGMNVQPYIDKGILLDLSDMVNEMTANRNMVEPVLRTYERDGQIKALPVKYHLPIMVATEQMAAEVITLDDLVRYAVEHPERGIKGDLSPEALIKSFLPSCAPVWITDSGIDTEQLSAYLNAMAAMMNTGAQSYPYPQELYDKYDDYVFELDKIHYAYERSHAYFHTMPGVFEATELTGTLETREHSVITYMPGQQEKSFIPATIVGINVNSKQIERAKDFLNMMLSDSVQYDGGDATGFAVSVKAQEHEAAFRRTNFYTFTFNPLNEDGDVVEAVPVMTSEWAPLELQQHVVQLAQGVEHPAIVDETLATMIVDASVGYLTGEKSLEQAIADVEEATKLYLAE